jgi:hypothetical protein
MVFTTSNHYFTCGSQYITFDGLKDDGNRATISFKDVTDCLGLIQNGIQNGYSSITVQNIHVASVGTTTLDVDAGWVCQRYFGRGSSDVLIDNCYSEGNIDGDGAGGICGDSAGYSGTVTISNSYSRGEISGTNAGGICGSFAGHSGTVTISNSYSRGEISGTNAGGICGSVAAAVTITNSYSLYATGDSSIETGGMVGSGAATFSQTYGANGIWSSDDANNQRLTGTPTDENNPGTVWGYHFVNTPYYLTAIPTPTPPSTLDDIIASGDFTPEDIIQAFPTPTATVATIATIEYVLSQPNWDTIEITGDITEINTLKNNTSGPIIIIATKFINLIAQV